MDSLILLLALVTNGLYAGFLLAFLIAVMPGLAALPDPAFTAAMRRFDEKVPGPVFLVLFAGAVVFPVLLLVVGNPGGGGWTLPLAASGCAVVSHLITVAGNVPLKQALAVSEGGDDTAARTAFDARWNVLHQVRTAFSVAAAALLAATVL